MNVIEAIKGRASVRAYLDRPVDRELVEEVLGAARWAPSGVNTQPWHVRVVMGETKRRIGDAIVQARRDEVKPDPDYKYYADHFKEPYRSRRHACGYALYGALGIQRDDLQRRTEQWMKNYYGFGAPVELFIFIDAELEKGSWLDIGMFIQNIMLAARGYGLETCPQAALSDYPAIVRNILSVPESLSLVCGVAMGYADWNDPVNKYRTERVAVNSFTEWHDC